MTIRFVARSCLAAALLMPSTAGAICSGCGAARPNGETSPPSAASSGRADAKARQCIALMDTIAVGTREVESTGDPGSSFTAADFRALSETMNRTAAGLSKLPLALAELRQFSDDYRLMALRVAEAARAMSAALDALDSNRIESGAEGLRKAIEPEQRLAAAINAFCHAP